MEKKFKCRSVIPKVFVLAEKAMLSLTAHHWYICRLQDLTLIDSTDTFGKPN